MYAVSLLVALACQPAERVPERVEDTEPGDVAGMADPASAEASAELARARDAEIQAIGEEEDARARLQAARADVSAAEEEIRAAEANRDQDRLEDARALLTRRKAQEEGAEALVRWKELERVAATASLTAARAGLDVRRSEHELDRLDEVRSRGQDAGYTRSDFLEQLADNQRRWEDAQEEVAQARIDADEARTTWMRVRGEIASEP
ncbi:MAG: hypothetical protein ACK4YP_17710 [Myxococcota bacterium]